MESHLHWLFLCDLDYTYVLGKGEDAMNGKIQEIYQLLLSETDYLKEAGKDIEKAVEYFLQKNSLCLNEKEYEEIRDQLFIVTGFTEEIGFVKGFQYAVMLIAECYAAKELL